MGRKRGFSAVEDVPVSTSIKRKSRPVPANTIASIDLSSSPEPRKQHEAPQMAPFRQTTDGLELPKEHRNSKGKARERGDDGIPEGFLIGHARNRKATDGWVASLGQRPPLPRQFTIEDWDYDPGTLDAEQLDAIAVAAGAGANTGTTVNASTHNPPSLAEPSSSHKNPHQTPAHPEEVGLEKMAEVIVEAVLTIIPQTDRDHLTAMAYAYLTAYGSGNIVEALVQQILEHPLVEGEHEQPRAQGQNLDEGMGGAHSTGHRNSIANEPTDRIELSIHTDGLPDKSDKRQEGQGDGVWECGCCYGVYEPTAEEMAHCSNTTQVHRFCFRCVILHAEHQIGNRDPVLVCIHTSGCSSSFATTELRRLLPKKLLVLYERLWQQKELKEANILGLEDCPFCDWACIMEAPKEVSPTMICGNQEECGVVSCRLCRRKHHPSKSCKEMETANNERTTIEEAMTEAVKRSCPKCSKPFIKTDGCNKMTCPDKDCRALSCYVCKIEIAGYEHFRQDPNDPPKPICPLWDDVNLRHQLEVGEVVDRYNRALPNPRLA